MTNKEFNAQFARDIEPALMKHFPNDLPKLREAWHNELEDYARSGKITERQRDRWSYPARYDSKSHRDSKKKLAARRKEREG